MPAAPNQWEHLQSVLLRVHNQQVRDGFRADVPDDDINTPETALKHACLIKDSDTAAMASCRMMLYYFIREAGSRMQPPIWAVPDFTPDVYNELRPQVILLFAEKTDDWKARGATRRKVVRVSYRLMNETSATLTEANVRAIANKIDLKFPRTYRFKTGRYKVTYSDKPKGYHLITAPYTPGEGDQFIKDILSLENTAFEEEKRTTGNQPGVNYRERQRVNVQGRQVDLPERRQIATVYLDRVELNIYGNQKNLVLIDRMISHRRYGQTAQYL
ncbi:MAG: hypothetical protein AB8B99_03030 [Phormidesmis sp.]